MMSILDKFGIKGTEGDQGMQPCHLTDTLLQCL